MAQETFITAWKHLGHLHEREKLRAWLCGIARNRINNFLRREYKMSLDEAETDIERHHVKKLFRNTLFLTLALAAIIAVPLLFWTARSHASIGAFIGLLFGFMVIIYFLTAFGFAIVSLADRKNYLRKLLAENHSGNFPPAAPEKVSASKVETQSASVATAPVQVAAAVPAAVETKTMTRRTPFARPWTICCPQKNARDKHNRFQQLLKSGQMANPNAPEIPTTLGAAMINKAGFRADVSLSRQRVSENRPAGQGAGTWQLGLQKFPDDPALLKKINGP